MSDYTVLRPYTPAEAARVVEAVNADAARTTGLRRAVIDGVGAVRLSRYVPASADRVVAVNARGEVAGFAYLADRERRIIYEVGGAVHPDHWERGVGSRLLAWAEERARRLSDEAPPGVQTVLQINLFESEARAVRLVERAGFAQAREWLHLMIDLAEPPASPALPEGWAVRPFDLDEDWDAVGSAMDEAFADHWGAILLDEPEDETESGEEEEEADGPPEDESYSNAPGYCFVLQDGATVVGAVLCNARLVERDDAGRVGSLFVRPSYRRRGAGRVLMLAAFRAFWDGGVRRIILDTDAASFTEAPRFYTGLGMRPYRRERLYEKVVRPGREVRRLSEKTEYP